LLRSATATNEQPPHGQARQPERLLWVKTSGDILIVQYPGPTTGGLPIYAGRFNMEKRRDISEERTDL
jgi:hypothetical protein